MEKKHISIIGSCVSRNLFNTSLLNKFFILDKYCFKMCVWDLFRKGLNTDIKDFTHKDIPEFISRMMWYDTSKNALKEVEDANSEYLMVDFVNILDDIDKIYLGEDYVYVQDMWDRFSKHESIIKKNANLNGYVRKRLLFSEFDKKIVFDGIKKFANWVNLNFESEKVIIYITKPSKSYYNLSDVLADYNYEEYLSEVKRYNEIEEYTQAFIKELNNPKVLYDVEDKISTNSFIDLNPIRPNFIHYSAYDNHRQAKELLSLLNICLTKNDILYFSDDYNKLNNQYLKSVCLRNKNSPKIEISLNDYVDKIENLKSVIIVISARDEASQKIKYFRNKFSLGINCKINFRDSYVSVIDKSRNFVYENNSQGALNFEYETENGTILVKSAGFNSGNHSFIFVKSNAESALTNLSLARRGLNIVILNSKTLEVVDQANVDSFADENLKVYSTYFSNMKIKA